MAEKRFELIESWDCSDIEKEDLKCLDECEAAAHELGYFFSASRSRSQKAQPISKSCYMYDGIVVWKHNAVGDWPGWNWTQAICRKNGKSTLHYCIA